MNYNDRIRDELVNNHRDQSTTYYALSLHQPWAQFVVDGLKLYETRSFHRKYRGVLYIHASKRWDGVNKTELDHLIRAFPETFSRYRGFDFPLGCIVAATKLTHIYKVEDIRDDLPDVERAVGNYRNGRYAWRIPLLKVPRTPIPLKGQLGIFQFQFPADFLKESLVHKES